MRDNIFERWLTRNSITFEYQEKVRLDCIKVDNKIRHQIRLDTKLRQQDVDRYAMAYKAGDEFPDIVLWKNGAKLYLVNGLHRCAALKQIGRAFTDAYLMLTENLAVVDVLRRRANVLNGIPQSEEERVMQAVYLVDNDGYSYKDAAHYMLVKRHKIQAVMQLRGVNRRIQEAGADPTMPGLSDRVKLSLTDVTRPAILKRMVELCSKARLPADDMRSMKRDVLKARSDLEANEVLDGWDLRYKDYKELSGGGVARRPSSPLRQLPVKLKQLENWIHKPELDKLLSKGEVKGLIKECDRMVKIFTELKDRLRKFL